jgi:hypothetical protein
VGVRQSEQIFFGPAWCPIVASSFAVQGADKGSEEVAANDESAEFRKRGIDRKRCVVDSSAKDFPKVTVKSVAW